MVFNAETAESAEKSNHTVPFLCVPLRSLRLSYFLIPDPILSILIILFEFLPLGLPVQKG